MIFAIGLLAGGRIAFVFFPSPESTRLLADVRFVAGTPPEVTTRYVDQLYQALLETEKPWSRALSKRRWCIITKPITARLEPTSGH